MNADPEINTRFDSSKPVFERTKAARDFSEGHPSDAHKHYVV